MKANLLHLSLLTIGLLASLAVLAAQSCPAGLTATTPSSRFTVNGDGTVTDGKTGLMWKTCVEGMAWSGTTCTGGAAVMTWQGALQQPGAVNAGAGFAGHADWRLPNIKELQSIVERACYGPSVNLSVFPGDLGSFVWSASPVPSGSGVARSVGFGNGGADYGNYRGNGYAVRLVRAGQ